MSEPKDLMTKLHEATEGFDKIFLTHMEEYGANPSEKQQALEAILGFVQRCDIRAELLPLLET